MPNNPEALNEVYDAMVGPVLAPVFTDEEYIEWRQQLRNMGQSPEGSSPEVVPPSPIPTNDRVDRPGTYASPAYRGEMSKEEQTEIVELWSRAGDPDERI